MPPVIESFFAPPLRVLAEFPPIILIGLVALEPSTFVKFLALKVPLEPEVSVTELPLTISVVELEEITLSFASTILTLFFAAFLTVIFPLSVVTMKSLPLVEVLALVVPVSLILSSLLKL